MDDKLLLSLDLSTTCTGWSLFKMSNRELIEYGILKPSIKGLSKLKYPEQQLLKMINLSEQLLVLIENFKPHLIIVEEIAGSRQRLGQKVLDGLHWIFLLYCKKYINLINYYDVTGADGWRNHLNLRLSDSDKEHNKEAKKLNKIRLKGTTEIPVIGPKHLACQYVNHTFKKTFNVDVSQFDADICDSIAMGHAFLKFRCTKV